MHQEGVERPAADQYVALEASAGIEQEDIEAFDFRIEVRLRPDVEFPIFKHFGRRVAQLEIQWSWAFSERRDFVFLGLKFWHG